MMLKTKRRKDLERKEEELYRLKNEISDLKYWCAQDSGEIAFAMLHLENKNKSIDAFRKELRKGEYTFDKYIKTISTRNSQ